MTLYTTKTSSAHADIQTTKRASHETRAKLVTLLKLKVKTDVIRYSLFDRCQVVEPLALKTQLYRHISCQDITQLCQVSAQSAEGDGTEF